MSPPHFAEQILNRSGWARVTGRWACRRYAPTRSHRFGYFCLLPSRSRHWRVGRGRTGECRKLAASRQPLPRSPQIHDEPVPVGDAYRYRSSTAAASLPTSTRVSAGSASSIIQTADKPAHARIHCSSRRRSIRATSATSMTRRSKRAGSTAMSCAGLQNRFA